MAPNNANTSVVEEATGQPVDDPAIPESLGTTGNHRVDGTTADGQTSTSISDTSIAGDGEKAATPFEKDVVEDKGIGTKSKVIIVLALCMNLFLSALDQTIISTALPRIVHDLGDAQGFAWCASAFLIAASAFIPSWGKFSDIWGRKPILMTASVIFLIGSVVSATARTMAALIAGRTVQGLGAGGIVALVNITVSDIVTVRERGKYLALVGFTWAVASSLGPIIGGLLTSRSTWRWCFWLNLPVGGCSMTAIFFFLHLESPKISVKEGLKRVDWVGTLLSVVGTCFFLVGLESGGVDYAWDSALVLCFLVIGVALLAAFLVWEWRFAKIPIMPTRLFNMKTRAAAYIVCFWHGQVFIAASFYLPLYFQSALGEGPLLSGVIILPYVIMLSLASAMTGGFISKTGRYQEAIWAGLIVMSIGSGLLPNLRRNSGWAKIVIYQLVAGFGTGPLFQGPLIAIHSTIAPQDIGTATAAFAFIRNVSAAIGVSIGNVIFQNSLNQEQANLIAKVGRQSASLVSGKNANANVQVVASLPDAIRIPLQDAYALALSHSWWYFFAASVCALITSAFIGKHELSKTLTSSQAAKRRPSKADKLKTAQEKEVNSDVV